MSNKSQKPLKPVFPAPAKPSEEEQRLQVARYLANEKKTYFQVILANLIQAGTHPKDAVDLAIEAADYAIEKLYPVEKKED